MGESHVTDVDDAFQLLLLIIGLVLSIFNSHPEALLSARGGSPEFVIQVLLRLSVIPLLVLTFIWIGAKLIKNVNYAIFLKLIDWMMAIILTEGVLYLYFRETGFFQATRFLETLSIVFPFVVPIFVYYVVVPRYKEMYPNASFFEKKWRFILAFLLSMLLLASTLYFATVSLA